MLRTEVAFPVFCLIFFFYLYRIITVILTQIRLIVNKEITVFKSNHILINSTVQKYMYHDYGTKVEETSLEAHD